MRNIQQTSTNFFNTVALASTVFVLLTSHTIAQQISSADQEYFEAKIRPILVDYCLDCHSAGTIKGSLDLGSKDTSLSGGSTGPAVVPGNPGKSLIIQRIKDLGDPMPPAGKDAPAESQIAELENWIRRGAPDPRSGKSAGVIKSEQDKEKARQHWAFQKVKPPTIPSPQVVFNGKLKNWVKNPIDAYVLKDLEKENMVPSLPADKWSLLRRIYFDLIGLPPSFDDAQRFVNGQESYEQAVDRLLASPQYGERWGRYWLDVARYADTTGNDNRRGNISRYVYAHTYRDWVVNAFNEDKPYDKFLVEQIAADRQKDKQTDLAALGFLTLGPRILGGDEIIDDRIDVITRGTMGIAVYCARCHDHKFDPISMADYYSLYGVFNSSYEPPEEKKPILMPNLTKVTGSDGSSSYDSANPDYAEYLAEKKELEEKHQTFRRLEENKVNSNSRDNAATYMYWTDVFTKLDKRVGRNRGEFEKLPEKTLRETTGNSKAKSKIKLMADVGDSWQRYLSRKSEQDLVFGPWKIYSNVSTNHLGAWFGKDRKKLQEANKKVASMISNTNPKTKKKGKQLNPYVANMFRKPPASMQEVTSRYRTIFDLAKKQWLYANDISYTKRKQAEAQGKKMDPPKNMEDAQKRFGVEFDKQFGKDYAKNMDEIRRVLFDRGHPGKFDFDALKRRNGRLERAERDRFISKLESMKINHPGSPPRAMVLLDKGNPRDEAIKLAGGKRGKVVPRQFLEILSGPDHKPFKTGSGRLELGRAIADKENPLTARVMVNRIWMHHFGKGIVSSINEFGLRAADPTHPELLDYLAWYFTENNWSMKALHKHILMSNTYQQTSDDNPRYSVKDPDNIHYYKMNRRRMDFESFRDGLLQVSGKLDLTMGGKPLRLTGGDSNYRRSVYALIDRRDLDEMLKTFDFANPNSTAGQRFTSTVSQQALFMMNSTMLADLANQIVSRKEFKDIQDDRNRIVALYNMIYQRNPEPIELKLGQRFLQEQTGNVATGAMRVQTWYNGYGQWDVLDAKNKIYTVKMFQFPYTDGKVFKGNSPAFGPLELTATGGHPGTHPNVAVIRRWIAPMDTTVNISGRLEHKLDTEADAAYQELSSEAKKLYDKNAWDGVTGIIVWSRGVNRAGQRVGKELWRSDVRRGRRDTAIRYKAKDLATGKDLPEGDVLVKRGDTIDFIVTCNKYFAPQAYSNCAKTFKLKNGQQDNFMWNPTVKIKPTIAKDMEKKAGSQLVTTWTAADDFQGSTYKPKPLNPWEKYVQVLLLSNEVAYVD